MFRSYFTTAWRNLKRRKLYTALSLGGFAAAMACALVIFLFIQHEWSFDRFHADANRIFRLSLFMKMDIGERGYAPAFSYVAPLMKEHLPGIEDYVRLSDRGGPAQLVRNGRAFEVSGLDTEPNFLDIFDFPLLAGSRDTVLRNPDSILLTADLARRIFGSTDPLGQTLTTPEGTGFTVTGVLENVPENSHMPFQYLTASSALRNLSKDPKSRENVDLLHTYLQLAQGQSAVDLEAKFPAFLKDYVSPRIAERHRYFLQPLTSIHLRSHLFAELGANGDVRTTTYLALLGLFILTLAGVNYMNIQGSITLRRSREVGIRKVTGADSGQILGQFLTESVLTAFLSVVLAGFLADAVLPFFNSVVRRNLTLDIGRNLPLLAAFFGLALVAGLFSGSVPALLAARFQPVQVIKGKLNFRPSRSGWRTVLVVFQFAVCTGFLIATFVIVRQLQFIQNKDLGFGKDGLILLDNMRQGGDIFKQEAIRNSRIQIASLCDYAPGQDLDWPTVVVPEGTTQGPGSPKMATVDVDEDYFEAFEIPIVQGRNFVRGSAAANREAVIVNETAARELGWPSPIGRRVYVDRNNKWFTIIGVAKDVHFESLRRKIGSYLFISDPTDGFYTLAVKTSGGGYRETLDLLGVIWKKLFPNRDFAYRFLDDRIRLMYEEESRTRNVLSMGSLLAILISCLGLFGLASLAAEARTKDIGIRKILGASSGAIWSVLSRDFLKYVLAANLFAWPAAYFFMKRWLEGFAYRIPLRPWIFLAAAVVSMALAILSVGYHAVRASRANPVRSLRHE
jgi:putative ABC transport system permease protein